MLNFGYRGTGGKQPSRGLITKLIKRESKRKDFMKRVGKNDPKMVMGKTIVYEKILPVKQRYNLALINVV